MRSRNSDLPTWHFVPVQPGIEASFRRWNVVIIVFLAMLVLGLFTLALVPQARTAVSVASKVPVKMDRDPAPRNLAEFTNGYATVVDPALPAVVNFSARGKNKVAIRPM
jgi:hypothetical protein